VVAVLPAPLLDGGGRCVTAIALLALTMALLLLAAALTPTVSTATGVTVLAVGIHSVLHRCAAPVDGCPQLMLQL
jgi:hypothetical protein